MIGRLSLRAALASVAIALAGTALADEELATATTEETSAEVEASPEAATGEEATTEGEIAEDPSPPSLRLYSRYAYICSLDIALGATPETLEGHEYETRYRILEEWSETFDTSLCYRRPSIMEECGASPTAWICHAAPEAVGEEAALQ